MQRQKPQWLGLAFALGWRYFKNPALQEVITHLGLIIDRFF